MKDGREFNMKRFLQVLPMDRAKPPTFWAQHPDNVPARIRRAADTYEEIAKAAETAGMRTAKLWRAIADIFAQAAAKAEEAAAQAVKSA